LNHDKPSANVLQICAACRRSWYKSVHPKEKKPARVGKPRGPERAVVCHNKRCAKEGGNTTQWHPVPGVDGAYVS